MIHAALKRRIVRLERRYAHDDDFVSDWPAHRLFEHTRIELESGETLTDVAMALNIEPAELERRIQAGIIEVIHGVSP